MKSKSSLTGTVIVVVVAAALSGTAIALGGVGSTPATPATGGVSSPVFSSLNRPRATADVLPAQLASGIAAMNAAQASAPVGMSEGTHQIAGSRRVLAAPNGLEVFALATDSNRTCFATTAGGGGCLEPEDRIGWVELLRPQLTGVPVAVAGIVSDDVVSMSAETGGGTSPVLLRGNGFYVGATDRALAPSRLVLTLTDGSVQTVDLPDPSRLPE